MCIQSERCESDEVMASSNTSLFCWAFGYAAGQLPKPLAAGWPDPAGRAVHSSSAYPRMLHRPSLGYSTGCLVGSPRIRILSWVVRTTSAASLCGVRYSRGIVSSVTSETHLPADDVSQTRAKLLVKSPCRLHEGHRPLRPHHPADDVSQTRVKLVVKSPCR